MSEHKEAVINLAVDSGPLIEAIKQLKWEIRKGHPWVFSPDLGGTGAPASALRRFVSFEAQATPDGLRVTLGLEPLTWDWD